MTKLEFEELQRKFNTSGTTLKAFLKSEGVAYSTYNYWSNKAKEEGRQLPIAPIEFRSNDPSPSESVPAFCGVDLPGVTLAFPNGVRAHFGRGSESILVDVLSKSMTYVLPQ